ncbi:DUF4304 domain-containing protein [Tundrisphaera lichenicola]|uniref:DUF4304 domain-containing protein n=1 Tax=Tundrisphaera lichenicola TaxID=2029860 RepID=UPI003EB96366
MSEPIRALFDKTLHDHGFKKASGSWYFDGPETVLVANLQKSQYGSCFYINLGVWLKAIGEAATPKEHHCHVRIRLESLAGEEFSKALDMEASTVFEEDRKMIIVTGIVKVAIPWLEACNSLDGIREMLHEGRLSRALVHRGIRERVRDLRWAIRQYTRLFEIYQVILAQLLGSPDDPRPLPRRKASVTNENGRPRRIAPESSHAPKPSPQAEIDRVAVRLALSQWAATSASLNGRTRSFRIW